jgi:hypothetical protein
MDELGRLAAELDARKPADAAARTRAYLAHGYPTSGLLEVLANHASRDSASANGGINLIFADACVTEFLTSKAPEIPMALAKMIAASPKDQAAFAAWEPQLTT